MVQHEKGKQHESDKQQAQGPLPPHQGPVPAPTPSEILGGTGSPTSGPTGEPMVKAPELPGQPKEGSESAAGEVGETDLPGEGTKAQQEDTSKKK